MATMTMVSETHNCIVSVGRNVHRLGKDCNVLDVVVIQTCITLS